jgi:probable HAF family extracellular repeat protein
MRELELPSGASECLPYAISRDGSVVVGECGFPDRREAFRWTAAEGVVGLGYLPGRTQKSIATGISGDAAVIVGFSQATWNVETAEACRWNAQGDILSLGAPPGGVLTSHAFAVSADGATVVGSSAIGPTAGSETAFRWTALTGMMALETIPGEINATRALAVSADGSVIVGRSIAGGISQAFRWTPTGGMVGLGHLYSSSIVSDTWASDVSADGTIVVGTSVHTLYSQPYDENPYTYEAIIWDEVHGIRRLQDVLINEYSLNLAGWTLTHATGVSGDGRTIVGTGTNPYGDIEGWIARLSEPAE